MCGISAIFSTKKQKIKSLAQMNDEIVHRGPDDEGYFLKNIDNNKIIHFSGKNTPHRMICEQKLDKVQNNLSLEGNILIGHRRLSIRDLSYRGHQPMHSDCGGYTIVYNGEIYNAENLRKKLIKKGYKFSSTTDTEVILIGYIEWKEKLLPKLNGMFSFIITNLNDNKIFIARDRFGIKPLYYWYFSDTGLALASEIKQFTRHDEWKAILNKDRAYDFLNWGQTDHTNETMFKGVFHVPAGHFCTFSIHRIPKSLNFSQWYKLSRNNYTGTFEDASNTLKELLIDSVKIRMKADVSIGTCLSGGLDSSSIVCIVNELLQQQNVQKTYSSCSQHKLFDERDYIYEVLKKTKKVKPYLFELDHKEFKKVLPELIYNQDEPFLSPSVFAEWSVFREVNKSNVKVTLDGHGADEQLCGYHTFFGSHLSDLFRKFKWIKLIKEIAAFKRLYGYGVGISSRKIIRSLLPASVNNILFRLTNRKSIYASWINLNKLDVNNNNCEHNPILKSITELSHDQILKTSIPKQLRWCDRDSMSHSVESRLPFLDYRLVEFLFSLPSSFKIDKGITKVILRKSMNSYLPNTITNRIDKMGFVTPAEIWVKEEPSLYKSLIENLQLQSKGILNEKASRKFKNMINGKTKFDHSFWRAIFFAQWMDTFQVEIEP
jgi:asparagine synthase (glutamine-hydrolysing)